MNLDVLDHKLNKVFAGKVVRKDLLLQVKKGTNVPSFVLEFLLARYCASDDPREIQEGMAAVLETIQKNYVRPDESNKAQMIVQQKGKHTFIDKIHVKYFEKQKRPCGAETVTVEDPYMRQHHQITNFLRFCETAVRLGPPKRLVLVTKFDSTAEKEEAMSKLSVIADSLKQIDISLEIKENPALHDREVRLSNGWSIKIGRGFDIYQKPDDWFQIGANDLDLGQCLETNVDIIKIDT